MECESDDDTSSEWNTWINPQMIDTGSRRLGNKTTSGIHPDFSMIKIGKNTKKSSGDLRVLAVTQTLAKYFLLTLV